MAVVSLLPEVVDFVVVQGDDVDFYLQLNTEVDGLPGPAVDLTGLTVRAEVKVNFAQAQPSATFTCTPAVQSGSLRGRVRLRLAGADLAKLPVGTPLHYDVQIGGRTRLRGTITTEPEVTRG